RERPGCLGRIDRLRLFKMHHSPGGIEKVVRDVEPAGSIRWEVRAKAGRRLNIQKEPERHDGAGVAREPYGRVPDGDAVDLAVMEGQPAMVTFRAAATDGVAQDVVVQERPAPVGRNPS